MTLTTSCKSCREVIRFNESVDDRVKLAAKRGENVELDCKACGMKSQYHVDDITADNNRFISVLNSLILLVGTPLLLFIIWRNIWGLAHIYLITGLLGAGFIPIFIYITIAKSQRDRQHTFNQHRLRGVLGTFNFRKE